MDELLLERWKYFTTIKVISRSGFQSCLVSCCRCRMQPKWTQYINMEILILPLQWQTVTRSGFKQNNKGQIFKKFLPSCECWSIFSLRQARHSSSYFFLIEKAGAILATAGERAGDRAAEGAGEWAVERAGAWFCRSFSNNSEFGSSGGSEGFGRVGLEDLLAKAVRFWVKVRSCSESEGSVFKT